MDSIRTQNGNNGQHGIKGKRRSPELAFILIKTAASQQYDPELTYQKSLLPGLVLQPDPPNILSDKLHCSFNILKDPFHGIQWLKLRFSFTTALLTAADSGTFTVL